MNGVLCGQKTIISSSPKIRTVVLNKPRRVSDKIQELIGPTLELSNVDTTSALYNNLVIFGEINTEITQDILKKFKNVYIHPKSEYFDLYKRNLHTTTLDSFTKLGFFKLDIVKVCTPLPLPPQKDNFVKVEIPEHSGESPRQLNSNDFFDIVRTSDKFIEDYTSSLKKLYIHKIDFYNSKIESLNKNLDSAKRKIEQLKDLGITDASSTNLDIENILVGIINIKEIISELSSRKPSKISVRLHLLEIEKTFSSIIGQNTLKNTFVRRLYAFSKNYSIITNSFDNYALLGNPGIGKTALAKMLAKAYYLSGILARDTVRCVSRADLVGGFLGQTAKLTRGVLMSSLESFLIIDEAYELGSRNSTNSNDYGSECGAEMCYLLDIFIGMLCVIVAGYALEMRNRFFTMNRGFARRFNRIVELKDYTPKNLTRILVGFLRQKGGGLVELDEYTLNVIFSIISEGEYPNQAGDMLNISEKIVIDVCGGVSVIDSILSRL